MHAAASHPHDRGPCCRGGPLGGLRPLSAVFQREAELSLRRTEMGRGQRAAQVRRAAVHKDSGQRQRLRHGGAGAELSQQRHAEFTYAEGGGNILIEQIPAKIKLSWEGDSCALFTARVNTSRCRALSAFSHVFPLGWCPQKSYRNTGRGAFPLFSPRPPRNPEWWGGWRG